MTKDHLYIMSAVHYNDIEFSSIRAVKVMRYRKLGRKSFSVKRVIITANQLFGKKTYMETDTKLRPHDAEAFLSDLKAKIPYVKITTIDK